MPSCAGLKRRRRAAMWTMGLLAGLLLAESGLRLGLGLGRSPLSHADPDYGYAFNPNQNLRRFGNRVCYNEHGLRSEPLPRAKPRDEFRVLCVGDSVTNGGVLTDQVDTYPCLLEALLKRRGLNGRVLNASAGGLGR